MSEDHRAGKSMSKEPKLKSRVKIHLPPASRAKEGVALRKTIFPRLSCYRTRHKLRSSLHPNRKGGGASQHKILCDRRGNATKITSGHHIDIIIIHYSTHISFNTEGLYQAVTSEEEEEDSSKTMRSASHMSSRTT